MKLKKWPTSSLSQILIIYKQLRLVEDRISLENRDHSKVKVYQYKKDTFYCVIHHCWIEVVSSEYTLARVFTYMDALLLCTELLLSPRWRLITWQFFLLLTCSFETSWTFRARMTSTRVATWSKAKKLPGNSFQKNFIFQFDCAASSPLCYAIPNRKDNRLYKHAAGNGGLPPVLENGGSLTWAQC